MPRRANYPDWVMKYKKKGTYVNKVGDTYYLYAAHSEYIKGTGRARRVSDGYLGRITEKDGFIPSRYSLDKTVTVYEFGRSYAILSLTGDIYSGLKKSYRKNAGLIYSASILFFIYGHYDRELFLNSYLSIRFPDVTFPDVFTKTQIIGIERGKRMLTDSLWNAMGENLSVFLAYFSLVSLLETNGKMYCSAIPEKAKELAEKIHIQWEDAEWKK